MERLVYWNNKEKGSALPVAIDDDGDVVDLETICAELARYQDTGLEPDDVRRLQKDWTGLILRLDEMGGMPHLNDLLAAEKDGRLVVLDEKTALAMAAGSYAIRNTKKYETGTYMAGIRTGNRKEISFYDAGKTLYLLSEAALGGEER